MLVPGRPVRLRDAAIGGIFAGLMVQILRWPFKGVLTSGSTFATTYGTVAVLPIFVSWIYLSWNVIIPGAVLSVSFPDRWRQRDRLTDKALSSAEMPGRSRGVARSQWPRGLTGAGPLTPTGAVARQTQTATLMGRSNRPRCETPVFDRTRRAARNRT